MRIQLILASRYLMGRKLRTFLTTLAVVFAALVIFGMNTMLPTMLEAFQTNILAASGQVDVTVTQKTGEAFAPTVLTRVKAVPGVRAVAGSLNRTIKIPSPFFPREAQVSAVSLVGIEPRPAQGIHNYTVKQGRFLRTEDTDAALITQSLANTLGLKVGSTLRLPTTQGVVKLVVVGLRPARTLPGNEEVLVVLSEAQKLFGAPNRVNTIEAVFISGDAAQRTAIKDVIQAQLGEDYQLGALSGGTEIMASMQTGQMVFSLFGFLALFMGGFIIFNTFRTVVVERRHDIGMLRALGASRGTIIGLFLAEGLLQGAAGTLIGMALGYLMALGIVAILKPVYEQWLHMQLGAPVVAPGLVVTTVSLGIGVTLLAGLLPALSAGRLTPLEALRRPTVEAEERRAGMGTFVGVALIVLAALALLWGNLGLAALGALLFLIGLALVTPVLVRPLTSALGPVVAAAFAREGTGLVAEGSLTRQPGRAAVTASATMIALAIVVTAAGLLTSMNGFTLTILRKTLGSDYLLVPPSVSVWSSNVGANKGLADRLRTVPGVGAVSTMRFAMAEANNKTVSVLGVDPAVFPRISGLNFQSGDARTAFDDLANGRTLIANGIFASQAGMKVGGTVRLSTPTGAKEYRVVAIAGDYLNVKIPLAVLAFPSLIALLNTLAIGVIERTREIGMLRAIGATQRQVRRMVIAEALLLAGIGTLFGLAAGLYLSYASMFALSAGGYPLVYSFPLGGLVAAIVIGLSFGALAALLPARQAAGLEIVRALQYE